MATITKILIRFVFFISITKFLIRFVFFYICLFSSYVLYAQCYQYRCLVHSRTSVTFINMNVPVCVKKELFVKTSIPIFKITTFQFVFICGYSDIKNMHEI